MINIDPTAENMHGLCFLFVASLVVVFGKGGKKTFSKIRVQVCF